MSEAPSLVLDTTSHWYGEVLAVDEVTAEFGPGVTGLLGPNGAGKSTLLKIATGMLKPSLGTVSLCGFDPARDPRVMRRVGLVPEQDPVYARASAVAVVTYLTRLQGFSRDEARTRATSALVRVGLAEAMNRSVASFSKGMKQRAKLAQALAHDPDVLILDEPLNGLDPVGRRDMVALLRELGAEGRLVLVSSHVLHEVESVAKRVLLMAHGLVVADGTIQEIRRDMSDRPLAVRVHTQDAKGAARVLVALDGTRRVDMTHDGLVAWTVRPDALFDALATLGTADGVPIDAFETTDESLEAVFRYLTTQEAPA